MKTNQASNKLRILDFAGIEKRESNFLNIKKTYPREQEEIKRKFADDLAYICKKLCFI